MSFRFGLDRFKGGSAGIEYDDSGRILWRPGQHRATPVSTPTLQRTELPRASLKNTLTNGMRRLLTRGAREDPEKAFDRRYEWRHSDRSEQNLVVAGRRTDGSMVEDRLVYKEKPRFWWLFILIAILLIGLGAANILFCLDFHWYSRFYTGLLLMIFGILGLIHRGDTRTDGWRTFTVFYMVFGIITMALVFLCLGLVLATFVHETIDIAQYGDEEFIDITTTRIAINNESVLMNISSWKDHIWMCYAMDGVSVVCCLAAFLVLTSVVIVFDNFYNNNFVYIRQVEPFCEPMLFNPYGQISLGQVMIFFGFIIGDAVFGSNETNFQDVLPLVWAGILPIICGFVSAVAFKRTHKGAVGWAVAGIILQIINFILSAVALGIMTYGMYENIVTIEENYTMTTTNFSVQLIQASVIMFSFGDCVALASLFWSVACLICHFKRSCCGSSKSRTVFENDSIPYSRHGEIITTPYSQKRLQQVPQVAQLPVDRAVGRL